MIHLKMLWKSAQLVFIGFFALLMIIGFIFANAALGQWRVDQNMERVRMVETMVE